MKGFFYSEYIYRFFAETNELPHRYMVSWVVAQKKLKEIKQWVKNWCSAESPSPFCPPFWSCAAPQLTKHMEQACPKYIWVIDQVWGQDNWTLAFFCVFMDKDEFEVQKLAEKEWGQLLHSHPVRTSLVNKGLLYGFRGNSSCRTRRVVPNGED